MPLSRRCFLATPSALAGFSITGLGCAEFEQGNHVLATTTLVADLVRQLLPEEVPTLLLMGPGIDPHTYEPTAGTIAQIRQARLIVGHGLHLEGRLTELLETTNHLSPRRVFLITHPLENEMPQRLLESDGQWDPHVWFDASLWVETVRPLAEALIRAYPHHCRVIETNCSRVRADLHAIHREMLAGYGGIPNNKRILITSHDAFGYLGRAYGLEVHAIQGISTAAEVSESALRELAGLACEKRVSVGFLESTVSPRTIEKLRSLIRARSGRETPIHFTLGGVLFSDSLGEPGSGAETYSSMMRQNLRVITGALSHG
jgi:manganese/zinc/iron transport system substrate-binding protein